MTRRADADEPLTVRWLSISDRKALSREQREALLTGSSGEIWRPQRVDDVGDGWMQRCPDCGRVDAAGRSCSRCRFPMTINEYQPRPRLLSDGTPLCPVCRADMTLKRNRYRRTEFWSCPLMPSCKGSLSVEVVNAERERVAAAKRGLH